MNVTAWFVGLALLGTTSKVWAGTDSVVTGFGAAEGYATGATNNLAGQNGWVINDPPSAAGQLSFFYPYNVVADPGNIWAALGGQISTPNVRPVELVHPVEVPLTRAEFSVDFGVSSDTLGSRDSFGWVFKSATNALVRFAWEPDVTGTTRLDVVWYDGAGQRHATGGKLAYDSIYQLRVKWYTDGSDARFIATLGASVGAPFQFSGTLTGQSTGIVMGVGAYFYGNSDSLLDVGDNTMYFDNVTLVPRTTLLNQPTRQSVAAGDSATFSVTATGAPPLHYQWRKNGVPLSGATTATLTVPTVSLQDSGEYSVVVWSVSGRVVSAPAYLAVRLPGATPVGLSGRVVTTAGAALAGATVTADLFGEPAGAVQTDAGGNYQLPPLPPQVYRLSATHTGYAADQRVVRLETGTREQSFRLDVAPAAYVIRPAEGPSPITYEPPTDLADGSRLWAFDGDVFTNRPGLIRTDRMTVVLTHGWHSNPTTWALPLARAMATQGLMTNVNLLVWDWTSVAARSGPQAEAGTSWQGRALGRELQGALGEAYAQPVHFIGHSFGTLVNRYAADYLRGESSGTQPAAAHPWVGFRPHLTLFDEAEMLQLLEAPELSWLGNPVDPDRHRLAGLYLTLKYGPDAPEWVQPLPIGSDTCCYIDNYVSAWGRSHAAAVNVRLQPGADADPENLGHVYGPAWYRETVLNPAASLAGFRRSEEERRKDPAISGGFPPGAPLLPGAVFRQTTSVPNALEIQAVPGNSDSVGFFPIFGESAVDLIHPLGVGSAWIAEDLQVSAASVSAGAEWTRVDDSPANGSLAYQVLAGGGSAPGTGIWRLPAAPGPVLELTGQSTPVSFGVLTLTLPVDAEYFAFEYEVRGSGDAGVLLFGLEKTNQWTQPQNVVPRSEGQHSPLFPVRAWAGRTADFYFGLAAASGSDVAVRLRGGRFYTLARPRLTVEIAAETAQLSWPGSVNGYALESNVSLAETTWQPVSVAPELDGGRWVATVATAGSERYFRLRRW